MTFNEKFNAKRTNRNLLSQITSHLRDTKLDDGRIKERHFRSLRNLSDVDVISLPMENSCYNWQLETDELSFIISITAKDITNPFTGEVYVMENEYSVVNLKWKAMQLGELELSVRAYNCLRRHGIVTVDELLNTTLDELCQVRNIGTKSFLETCKVIKELKRSGYCASTIATEEDIDFSESDELIL